MTQSQQFELLLGRHVSSWIGTELAVDTDEPVVWADMSLGCLQFFELQARVSDRESVHWTAGLDDNGDYFGLRLEHSASPLEVFDAHGSDILRCRVASEIPTGRIELVETTSDEYDQIVRVELTIGGRLVALTCGKMIWDSGVVKVERPQEFILVEIDAQNPEKVDANKPRRSTVHKHFNCISKTPHAGP